MNEDNEFRAGIIFITWVATAAIFVGGSPTELIQFTLVSFAIILTIGMLLVPYLSQAGREKAKRQTGADADFDENEVRLRMLMDMLSYEDKTRIRAKLMNGFSDGELPVDEFLEEESAHSQL